MSNYDPATKTDKFRSLVYLVALLGLLIFLLVTYCVSRHGM